MQAPTTRQALRANILFHIKQYGDLVPTREPDELNGEVAIPLVHGF